MSEKYSNMVNGVLYHPKGSMCKVCEHVNRDCSHLWFAEMRVIEVNKIDPFLDGGMLTKTVECTDFATPPKEQS